MSAAELEAPTREMHSILRGPFQAPSDKLSNMAFSKCGPSTASTIVVAEFVLLKLQAPKPHQRDCNAIFQALEITCIHWDSMF